MAEAAAQAAALKAFQDAMQQAEGNGYNAGTYEMTDSSFWMYGSSGTNETQRSYIEEDERRLMESLQQGNLDMEMFQSGCQPPDEATAGELLRLLEQQQQEEHFQQHENQKQLMFSTSHQDDTFLNRPDKHYLTIAQNGKSQSNFLHFI
jgi:hypothetical protein